MLIIIGIVTTLGLVFGGFLLSGGSMDPIFHALPFEGMMIGGAGLGSFLTGNGGAVLKKAGSGLGKAMKGPKWKAEDYSDLLVLLFMLSKLIKTKGVIALEAHIEDPHESKIFNHVGKVTDDHHITDFICDYFRMTTMNFDDPYQVEDVMLKDLEKHHHEESEGAHALAILGEAFPALGIVAAVLGIVKTMGSIDQPVEILGAMIGGALVGTFLGILISYTMAGPLASRLQQIIDEEGHIYDVQKDFIIAHLHGCAPQIAAEIGRKAVPGGFQPTFYELDELLQEIPNDVFA
ncbi:MAG: flagellar motor stator protein MotA [Kordiimonadaceae bacterium]|jgi:chemotaxis protein MotA|nr:flagellar motor stator protein MotA [Kordiimonadaceae bacterium]MBT6036987.1 flagellar motor stator protein MotA [Kordiimonadaceae bacterium]MBT6328603.1 flagellar motor stator protein MotA [Kordiimonadaceae bacterium]MBT7581520.1 flagellar motor stator protein MotA [Kordiimonadaceae bacterium]